MFVFSSSNAYSTIYYVSNSGNDNNSGVTIVQPWKTLSKVNRAFLKPGDQVLFRKGDSWTGTLNIKSSGTTTNSITFDAYGKGANPLISGFTNISDWSDEGGGIYSKVINPESAPNVLTIDGVQYAVGRYPNNNNLIYESANLNLSITDHQLTSSINWTGAEVVIYKNEWTIERCAILNHTENLITYSSQTASETAKTGQYFLQNDIKTLDAFGEWYYSVSSKKIYVFFGNTNPTSVTTNISVINNLIKNTGGFDYINVKNIDFEGSISSAVIFTTGTTNCTFTNSNISFSGGDGFTLFGNDNKIENCILSNINGGNYEQINGGGIFISGTNAKVIGNSLTNIGIIPGQTSKIVLTIGITLAGNNSVAENNIVENTAYMGIYITASAEKCTIRFNRINRSGQLRSDSGGIYLGHDHPGTLITHNIVSNAGGNGIYLDENCTGVTVSNNTIFASSDNGIKIHISFGNTIKFNTIYDNPVGINYSNWTSSKTLYNNIVTDNIILAKPEQLVTEFISRYSEDKNFGNSERNYYIFSDYENKVFSVNVIGDNSIKSFLNWKSFSRTDANSTILTIKYKEGETDKLFFNNTNKNITFELGKSTFTDAKGIKITNNFVLEPFTSKILIGKKFEEINQKPHISDQSFHLKAPKSKNDSIGHISAYDADLNQQLRYSIYSGNDLNWFSIDSMSGKLYVLNDIDVIKGLTLELNVVVKDNSLNTLTDSARILIFIEGTDTSPPEINNFSIPSDIVSRYIPIEFITANDDIGIKGYFLSLSPDIPAIDDSLWTDSIPKYFYLTEPGKVILYARVKDYADNISNVLSDTIIVNFQDLSATYSEYLFEENSGNVVFDSYEINNGTVINNLNRGEGVLGNGLIFEGNGYLNLGKSYAENVNDQITISLWLKPDFYNTDLPLVTHGGIYTNTFELLLNSDSTSIYFITNGTLNTYLVANNVSQLWDGKWHHLAVTYNGIRKTIFLDGNIIAETEDSGNINSGFWKDLYIGAAINNKDTSYYHGILDEVNIYNYSKNEEDIRTLYHEVNRLLNAITIQEYISLCNGEDYNGWTETGKYSRILKRKSISTSYADSTVITNLIIYPNDVSELNASICEGDTLIFNNQKIFESGIFSDTLKTIFGCDSTVILILDLHKAYYTDLNKSICEGDTVIVNNQKIFEGGQYSFTLKSIHGCDSIISLNLIVNPAYQSEFKVSICEGDTYLFNNQNFYETGVYFFNLESVDGCDSTISLNLNINSNFHNYLYSSICKGDTLTFNDQNFYETGTYTISFKSIHGCDSIITLNLQVYPGYNVTEQITILSGTSYKNWFNSGTYQQDLVSTYGCDSIVVTNLNVLESSSQNIVLDKGWNIFSSNLVPAKLDFGDIFSALQKENILMTVLDENDKSYQKDGDNWINYIGEFNEQEGYKIRVNTGSILEITGIPVKLPLDINLKTGWNIISFPYQINVDAMDILDSLIVKGLIKKVQDERGNSVEFWGDQFGWINGIGNFNAGEGYLVEVNQNCILTLNETDSKSGNITYSESDPFNFKKKFEGNGFGHMNINISGLTNLQLEAEDELAAFDGENCVGVVKLSEFNITKNVASIKASISDSGITNGFAEGNKIDLLVWSAKRNKEFRPKSEVMNGNPIYQKHGSVFFRFISEDLESFKNPLHDLIIFPNPSKDKIHINFQVEPNAETLISLTDLTGREILNMEAKSIFEDLNLGTHPSGIYLIKITSGKHIITKKILKL